MISLCACVCWQVLLNIHNVEVVIGIALTDESLHRRNITHFGPTTLRSTLCYGMLRSPTLPPFTLSTVKLNGKLSLPHACTLIIHGWNTDCDKRTPFCDFLMQPILIYTTHTAIVVLHVKYVSSSNWFKFVKIKWQLWYLCLFHWTDSLSLRHLMLYLIPCVELEQYL